MKKRATLCSAGLVLLLMATLAMGQSVVTVGSGGAHATLGDAPAVVVTPPSVAGTQVVTVQTIPASPPQKPLKAAIVVQNHVQPEYRPAMDGLADLLTAELSNLGFLVVNPANAIGITQNTTTDGEVMPESSAARLAQTLGADYLITASLRSIDSTTAGLPPNEITTLRLRLTMSIATGGDGFAFASENIVVNGPQMTPQKMRSSLDGTLNNMLDQAATDVAAKFATRVAQRAPVAPEVNHVTVLVTCNYPGADIQVDGVTYGTVPARLKMASGVHNLRVSYPFCIPYEGMANFYTDGQEFNVSLELSHEGYARWKDKEFFETTIQRIKDSGATDDYVRRVLADGNAEMLRNSHFKWDGAIQTLTVEREGVPPLIYNPIVK